MSYGFRVLFRHNLMLLLRKHSHPSVIQLLHGGVKFLVLIGLVPLLVVSLPAQEDDSGAKERKGLWDLFQGRHEERENLRQKRLEELSARDGTNRLNYAVVLFQEGYIRRSQQLLEQFLSIFSSHPRHSEAGYYLASILEREGKTKDAFQLFLSIYHESPGHNFSVRSYLQAGRLALRLGKREEAKNIFTEIVQNHKGSLYVRESETELKAIQLDLPI